MRRVSISLSGGLGVLVLAACAGAPTPDLTIPDHLGPPPGELADASLAEKVAGLNASARAPELSEIPAAPTDLRTRAQWDAALAALASSRDQLLSDPDLAADPADRLSTEEFAAMARARAAAAAAAGAAN